MERSRRVAGFFGGPSVLPDDVVPHGRSGLFCCVVLGAVSTETATIVAAIQDADGRARWRKRTNRQRLTRHVSAKRARAGAEVRGGGQEDSMPRGGLPRDGG